MSAQELRSNPSMRSNGEVRKGISGIPITRDNDPTEKMRLGKRLSSPEKWEAKQLIASGVLDVSEFPNYDEELGLMGDVEEAEEDIEVELNEDEPEFLKGQTSHSLDLSPIKIVKNPDGSLQRAAMTQSALTKERREVLLYLNINFSRRSLISFESLA